MMSLTGSMNARSFVNVRRIHSSATASVSRVGFQASRPQQHWGADITQSAELRDEFNPYPNAFPDSMQQQQAQRYAAFFDTFLAHRDALSRVTFWGVTDTDSWLNNWPAGWTSYPLLFDRQNAPEPAFDAVVETARQ